jgi:hypothetical protein
MPTGKKLTRKQRVEIMDMQNTGDISVAATFEDHAMITKFAKEHEVTMHEALHAMLHDDCTPELVNVIKREVSIMMDAAKTEVNIIKKKWWQL